MKSNLSPTQKRDQLLTLLNELRIDASIKPLATLALRLASIEQIDKIFALWQDVKAGKLEGLEVVAKEAGVPQAIIEKMRDAIHAEHPKQP